MHILSACDVPQSRRLVASAKGHPVTATGQDGASIGRERHARDTIRTLAGEGTQRLPTAHVPQACRRIGTTGQDGTSIGREGHTVDLARMAAECAYRLPACYVPQARRLVP